MKKILIGLIAFALLVGMTGVVSANGVSTYCKVNGGGTVVYEDGTDMGITVSFTAQGICGSTEDVKGMVTIVDRTTMEKLQLDVVGIYCYEYPEFSMAELYLDDGNSFLVYDGGEGANAPYPMDGVAYEPFWWEYLSGNAQVKISEAP